MENLFKSPEHLRTLFERSTNRESFLHEIERLAGIKIVWGRIGQKASEYSQVKNKISLGPELKNANNNEFLCTVAHELNHAGHRGRMLLTGACALVCMVAIAAMCFAVFGPNPILPSFVIVVIIVVINLPLVIRLRSLWELQAEAFAAATIGLETHRRLQTFKKRPPGRGRVIVRALLPHTFYKNIEKLVKERNF